MMYEKKTSLRRKLFALALIPAIGAGIAVTSIPSVAGVLESMANTTAATQAETPAPESPREIYTAVENIPEYPGGMEALMRYLSMNIRYPEEAMKADIQGRVIVKFVVNQDGSVSDAEVVKGVDESLDKEALRVVSTLPKWTPGTVNGKPVDCYFTLPINFRLQDDTPKEQTAQ